MNGTITMEILDFIEGVYLQIIIDDLRRGKLNTQAAQGMSQAFIALLPFNSVEDINTKLKTFTSEYPLMHNLYMAVLNYEDEIFLQDKLTNLRGELKQLLGQDPPNIAQHQH